jgi:hypothetical protein
MKRILLLFLLLSIISCKKKADDLDLPKPEIAKDFDLELIDSVPETLLQGCGEYLTHDSIQGIALQYLFISDLTTNGLIRIDGRNIDLKRDSIKSRSIDADNYIQYFKNDSIEVEIKLKAIEKYDEGAFNQGVLTITRNRIKKVYKVKGDSGC